ncbi:MAG: DUF2179 domain-containing protein [Candidatus Promineifilaceae bacterium]
MFDLHVPPLTGEVVWGALFIFVIRVIGITASTVRVLLMMRGRRLLTALTGFIEVLLYVFAIGYVVNDLTNIWNVLAYSAGFVSGTLVGMWIDERTATGYVNVRIISRYSSQQIIEEIHNQGFGATVGWGHGKGGTVGMILAIVRRKEAPALIGIAEAIDPDAFITVEDARSVKRGYLRIGQNQG